jgi:MFS family permease
MSAESRSPSTPSILGPSTVLFLSFAGLSAIQFHGYLFERMGFSPLQIGLLLGAGYAAGILAPLAQVSAIRWLRGPRLPLVIAFAGAGAGVALLPHAPGYGTLLLLFFGSLFGSACVHPLTTACTLEVTRPGDSAAFFLVRTFGTMGFLAGCVASYFQPGPSRLPWLYLGFGIAFWVAIPAALRFFRPHDPRRAPEDILITPNPRRAPGFRRALRLLSAPRPRRLLWALAAMSLANSMALLVQGNYLTARFGGGQSSISLAWIVSTAVEIPLMILCARLVDAHGLRAVIGFGLLGTTVKLGLLGIADSYGAYLAGLAFHGCLYSGALGGFNLLVHRRYAAADRPTLQALGTFFYQGIPAALGGGLAGLLWDVFGLRSVYWVSAVIALGAGIYTLWLLPQLPGKRRVEGVESPHPYPLSQRERGSD